MSAFFRLFFFLIFLFFSSLFFSQSAWAAASLSFSPATKTVTLNDTFNVDIILNTGGSDTDGADVIVRYDGNKLNLVSASLGNLYANKLIADTSVAGKVTFRATSAENQSFNGTGTFATIVFKAVAAGEANLYFDFTSGSTTDSNVAYQGADILGSVANASYTLTTTGGEETGGTTGQASPSPSSSSYPVSGSIQPTLALLAGGFLIFLLSAAKLFFF